MTINTRKAAKATAPNPTHYVTADPAAAYKHFLPLVQALPEGTRSRPYATWRSGITDGSMGSIEGAG